MTDPASSSRIVGISKIAAAAIGVGSAIMGTIVSIITGLFLVKDEFDIWRDIKAEHLQTETDNRPDEDYNHMNFESQLLKMVDEKITAATSPLATRAEVPDLIASSHIARSVGVPFEVVVMTNSECSSLGEGWEIFREASGRFPIASGRGTDAVGNTLVFAAGETNGGIYLSSIGVENLPPHRHSIRTGHGVEVHDGLASNQLDNASGILLDFGNQDAGTRESGGYGVLPNVLEEVGEGRPLTNMPPFIVFNFCKKSLPVN